MHTSERLYYSDSFLKTFSGLITGVRESADKDGQPVWQLSLDRTAFYPTSGGQPFDTGLLKASSSNGVAAEIPIEQVEEDEEGAVWHFSRQPLPAGTRVEGRIDWDRRFDHMQQHTGQHLLSAIFLRELQLSTVSFHLGERISTIDLQGGSLTNPGLESVERIVNEIIGQDRAVTTCNVERAEAEAMLAGGRLRKLPEREGSIRLVDIADCDLNACGGTHVRSTGQIGGLLLRGQEKVSRGLRIEFVCGLRAVRTARADATTMREAGAMLSTGPPELPAAVSRLLTESKTITKERQKLREELAAFHAAELVREEPVRNGLRLVVREFKDRDRDYIGLLASRTAAAAPGTAVVFTADDADPARVFISRSADLEFNCGQILRESLASLGLRGGGSPDLAQGDVPARQQQAVRMSLADSILRAVADS